MSQITHLFSLRAKIQSSVLSPSTVCAFPVHYPDSQAGRLQMVWDHLFVDNPQINHLPLNYKKKNHFAIF